MSDQATRSPNSRRYRRTFCPHLKRYIRYRSRKSHSDRGAMNGSCCARTHTMRP